MRDDDDLSCAASILEAALGAFLAIEQPWSVAFSSTVAQLTPARSFPTSRRGSFIGLSPGWPQGGGLLRPLHAFLRSLTGRTARRLRRKGARKAWEPATDPFVDGGDSGSRALASRSFPLAFALCDEPSERGNAKI